MLVDLPNRPVGETAGNAQVDGDGRERDPSQQHTADIS